MSIRFSIIIPTKDRGAILKKSLDRLLLVNNLSELDIILVNDSQVPINIFEQELPGNLKIIQNKKSGVASARNSGAAKANAEWLIFMDDDMLVKPDTFEKLQSFCTTHPDDCLNVNWVYPEEMNKEFNRDPFFRYLHHYGFDSLKGWSTDVEWKDDELFPVLRITSQFLVIHQSTFQKVGGYDETYPYAGFEDHDMSKRMRDCHINIFIDPSIMIYHNEEDRMDLKSWLERKWRGAVTRRVAAKNAHPDLHIQYSVMKKVVYSIIYACRKFLLFIGDRWPKTKKLDFAFFQLVNRLLGAYSYDGYKQNPT